MAMRKKKAAAGAPEWMVTYGDMMTLLLCFFVLLLSFSTISEKDFEKALMSLKGALGVLAKERTPLHIPAIPRPGQQTRRNIEEIARRLRRRLQVVGRESDIKIEYDQKGGLKISFPSQVLFDLARAELRDEAYPVLTEVAELMSEVPEAFFEVRGHTDNLPLRSTRRFRDNLDLSYARADTVTRYLNERGNIPLKQFQIVACGEGEPVATNDTPEGRQVNRRVELFVRGELSAEDEAAIRSGIAEFDFEQPDETRDATVGGR